MKSEIEKSLSVFIGFPVSVFYAHSSKTGSRFWVCVWFDDSGAGNDVPLSSFVSSQGMEQSDVELINEFLSIYP